MAPQPQSISIQYDLRPAYYDKFRCLAGDCRFTCCRGWRISFNKKDYLALKRVEGSPELNETMKQAVRRIKKGAMAGKWYGEFEKVGGHCPLQREDGLCSLQLEKGHGALPDVCKTFPRTEAYSDAGYLERHLSPACEAVLELLWDLPEGVEFVADPLPKADQRVGDFKASAVLAPRYQDVRGQCIDFLQDRRYPLPQRILLMGLALKELVDGERDVDRWLVRVRALADAPETAEQLSLPNSPQALSMFLFYNIKVLYETRNLISDFALMPEEISKGLGIQLEMRSSEAANTSVSTASYLAAQARYEERFKDRAYFMENLMVSLFFKLGLPNLSSMEALWKGYVSFCNLYSCYRFMAVASCREGAAGDKAELFRLMVCASRNLIHNGPETTKLRDEFFQNDSATLAHMAILLSG